jgi:hypothetical protein
LPVRCASCRQETVGSCFNMISQSVTFYLIVKTIIEKYLLIAKILLVLFLVSSSTSFSLIHHRILLV